MKTLFFLPLFLLLACIGLYGSISHTVLARTSEFGIRVALGAQPSDVLRMVLRDGLGLAAIGVAAGSLAAAVGTRAIRTFLYGVDPTDPFTFAAALCALFGVAALACYLPARRATRVDPLVAMRAE